MSKQAVQHNTEVQVDKMSASPDMLIRQSKQNGYEWKNKMSKQAVSAGLMKQTMTTRSSSTQIGAMQQPAEYQMSVSSSKPLVLLEQIKQANKNTQSIFKICSFLP